MSRVLKDELQGLREKLMHCFRETLPTKQFNATLTLSLIWLHVIVDKEENSHDSEERRHLKDEFERGKEIVKEGIQLLYERNRRNFNPSNLQPSRNMPRVPGEHLLPRVRLLHMP